MDIKSYIDSREFTEFLLTCVSIGTDAGRFKKCILSHLQSKDTLNACSIASFKDSVSRLAQLGLDPAPDLGYVALIADRDTCKLRIMYKGLCELALNSGEVKDLDCDTVYSNDVFSYDKGLSSITHHRNLVKELESGRGNPVGAYAKAIYNDGSIKVEVMSFEEIENIRKTAKTDFIWTKHWGEMAKKTVLRRMFKRMRFKTLPTSIHEFLASEDKEDYASFKKEKNAKPNDDWKKDVNANVFDKKPEPVNQPEKEKENVYQILVEEIAKVSSIKMLESLGVSIRAYKEEGKLTGIEVDRLRTAYQQHMGRLEVDTYLQEEDGRNGE